jgi:hypothetical protein
MQIFCASALPGIERSLCDSERRRTVRGVYPHLDNVPVHSAKRSRQEMARTKATRVVHTVYSPDAAPSDFFFLGSLKGETTDFTANSTADIIS